MNSEEEYDVIKGKNILQKKKHSTDEDDTMIKRRRQNNETRKINKEKNPNESPEVLVCNFIFICKLK